MLQNRQHLANVRDIAEEKGNAWASFDSTGPSFSGFLNIPTSNFEPIHLWQRREALRIGRAGSGEEGGDSGGSRSREEGPHRMFRMKLHALWRTATSDRARPRS